METLFIIGCSCYAVYVIFRMGEITMQDRLYKKMREEANK